MSAPRRRGPLSGPRVERRKQTALRPAIIVGVLFEFPTVVDGRETARAVLRSRQLKHPYVRRVVDIVAPIEGGVAKRGHASSIPVFRGGVDEHHLRLEPGRNAGAQPVDTP